MKLFGRICLFSLLLFAPISISAQVIQTEHGASLSRLHGTVLNLLPQPHIFYAGSIGLQYLERQNFYLVSQLGYLSAGGRDTKIPPFSKDNRAIESFHYAQVNTTMRLRFLPASYELFVGIGPKLDVLLYPSGFKEKLFADYTLSRVALGIKWEAGVNRWFKNRRMYVGLTYNYQGDLTPRAAAEENKLFNNMHSLYMTFGYRLWSRPSQPPKGESYEEQLY